MEKITKKQFVEILTNYASVFCASVFRWNDEKCERAMENIGKIDEKAERRTVSEKHTSFIVFSGGSRLYFDKEGKNEYFSYQNKNGTKFVLQRTISHDDFDDKDYQDYIVYAIIEKPKGRAA